MKRFLYSIISVFFLCSLSALAGTITVSSTAFIMFSTSTKVQSYTVSGTSLGTNAIVITPPSNYQVSLSQSSGYASSLSLTPTSGSVATTTIYVRLTATETGTYTGNISHTSTGSTTQTKAVSGRIAKLPSETYMQGTTLAINGGNGNGIKGITIPISFQFGGSAKTVWDVSANGYIGFTGSTNVNQTNNTCITNSSADGIYVFWDAMNLDTTNCNSVLYGTFGSSPNRKFVVQYTNVRFDGTVASPLGTVQIIMYETTNVIQLQYRQLVQRDKSLGQGATIGVKVSNSKQYSYSCNAATIFEGLAIKYTPDGSGGYTVDDQAAYDGLLLGKDATAPPTIPDVNAPDSYTTVSQLAKFWWKASTSSSVTPPSYNLVISTNSDLSSPFINTTITDTAYRISTLQQLTGGTTYYWSIITSSGGCEKSQTQVNSFVASSTAPRYATFSPSGPVNMGTVSVGQTSSATTITLSGTNLTGSMTATVTGDFTIDNQTSVSGLTNGSTLALRFTPTTAGARTGTITLSGGGLDYDETLTITGTGGTPATVSTSASLSSFSTALGSASTSQSFTVSGTGLTADITVTAPTGYEIRTGSNAYGGSVTLTQSGGTVSSTTIDVRLTGASAGLFSGNITCASTGATTQNIAVSGNVTSISTSASLSSFTTALGSASTAQSFTVSGAGLTNDITITAPSGYEIRTGSNAYASTVTLSPASGTVSSTTIDVRLTGASAGLFSGNVTNASTGATTQNVAVSGNVASVSTSGTLSAFSTSTGTASASQSFTVSGAGLTANLVVTAPTGYGIRTGSNSYGTTVTLTPTSGSVSSTTIDVRLTGASAGSFSGNVTNASTGATTQNVAVSGTVSDPASISVHPSDQTICNGSSVSFSVTASNVAGYQWQEYTSSWANISNGGVYSNATTATLGISDVTGLGGRQYRVVVSGAAPPDATSNAATLTVTGTPSAPTASAASSVTASSFTASWSSVSGAADYRLDVSTDNTFASLVTGYNNLSVSGTSQSVTGLTSGTTYYYRVRARNSCSFTSSNSSTITQATATPGVSTSASLSSFSTALGTASASQSYTVSGSNLTGDITITAPTGYEIRTGSNAYAATVTLSPASGSVSSTTIDVRLTGASAGSFSGNITHASSGATTQNIAVSGNVASVSTSASLNSFSTSAGTASASQSFTVSGSGLTTDITVTAPTGFEIRTGSNAYAATVTLTPTSGSVSSTTIDVRLSGASGGNFSGNITCASTGATTQNIAVSGNVTAISTSGSLSAFSAALGVPSSSQSYTVSGAGLTADITITAPTGYEIRTGSNAYAATVTLTPTSGSVSSTTIDVRMTAASNGTFSGNITHASTGATTQNVAVTGTVSNAATVSVTASLSAFSASYGSTSSAQSYTVSGSNLSGDITITAPTGYEIRTGSNAYAGTVTLTPSSGSVSSTTIDVRLTGASVGSFSGNITHASTGATTQNIALSGTVSATAPVVSTQAYITAITRSGGTAGGNVTSDGGQAVSARGICWSTGPNPSLSDNVVSASGTTGSYTAAITGLTDGTLYYVRAFATNGTGTSYGSQVKFTAGRVYVNTSASGASEGSVWADAYSDLVTAISRIDAGEIWVAAGTYKPHASDRTVSFTVKEGVSLLGGFAGTETGAAQKDPATNATTLSGDIGTAGISTDNSYHVLTGTSLTDATLIDGFTVSGGNANGSALSNQDKGGGIYIIGAPWLKNLTITGNSATSSDSTGVYVQGAPKISKVNFMGNTSKVTGS